MFWGGPTPHGVGAGGGIGGLFGLAVYFIAVVRLKPNRAGEEGKPTPSIFTSAQTGWWSPHDQWRGRCEEVAQTAARASWTDCSA